MKQKYDYEKKFGNAVLKISNRKAEITELKQHMLFSRKQKVVYSHFITIEEHVREYAVTDLRIDLKKRKNEIEENYYYSQDVRDAIQFLIDGYEDKTIYFLEMGLEEGRIDLVYKLKFDSFREIFYPNDWITAKEKNELKILHKKMMKRIFNLVIEKNGYEKLMIIPEGKEKDVITEMLSYGYSEINEKIINNEKFKDYLKNLDNRTACDLMCFSPLDALLEHPKEFNKHGYKFKDFMNKKLSYGSEPMMNFFERIIKDGEIDLRNLDINIFDGLEFYTNHEDVHSLELAKNKNETYYGRFIYNNIFYFRSNRERCNRNLEIFFEVLRRNNVKLNLNKVLINDKPLLMTAFNEKDFFAFDILTKHGASIKQKNSKGVSVEDLINETSSFIENVKRIA